jgi:hypothetical protein
VSLYKINKHVLQVWLWLFGLSWALLLVLVLALHSPSLQRYAAQQVTRFLSGKLKTRVAIGSFSTDWRNHFVLEDFYLEDQHQDTLVFAKRLGVNLDFRALLRRQISISDVALSQAVVRVKSTEADSAYNFAFIRRAFSAPDSSQPESTLPFTYHFGELQLDQVRVQILDPIRGNYILARIGHFGLHKDWLDRQPGSLQFSLVDLDHASIQYRQTKLPEGGADPLHPDLDFKEIRLNAVRLHYANVVAAQQLQVAIGQAQVLADTFNLKKARIKLADIQVSNSFFSYYQGRKVRPDSLAIRPARTIAKIDQAVEQATRVKFPGWFVKVQRVSFRNTNLALGCCQGLLRLYKGRIFSVSFPAAIYFTRRPNL